MFMTTKVSLAKPKLKMMGIETAKSSTPQWVRNKLTEALNVVMTQTEQDLWEFVETARKEFRNLPPKMHSLEVAKVCSVSRP